MADDATPPAKIEIKAGTPKFAGGKIVFEGAHHPEMAEATGKVNTAKLALRNKMGATAIVDDLRTEMAKLPVDKSEKAREAATALGAGDITAAKKASPELVTHLTASLEKHAGTELEAVHAAEGELGKVEGKLRAAQARALKGIKLESIVGYTEANKGEVQKAVDGVIKESKAAGMFGMLRAGKEGGGGFVAALDQNLGRKAWGASKGKFALNVAGTGLGVIAMGDAIFHGKRKDDKGDRTVDRSLLVRSGEFVGGGLLTVASALRGGRHI
jgi:hypothetical protein